MRRESNCSYSGKTALDALRGRQSLHPQRLCEIRGGRSLLTT